MRDTRQILKQLDAAIDRADMAEIERGLHALSIEQTDIPGAEDAKLFSARIQKLYKEQCNMKKPRISLRLAVAAAVILAMGVTVYAAGTWNLFSFQSGDEYVTVRTTDSMTQEEAEAFVQSNADTAPPDDAATASPETEEFSFDSVAQAEQALDMKLALPAAMPEMQLDNTTAQVIKFGDRLEMRTCWLNYSDEQGRMFGVTVQREVAAPGTPVTGYATHDMDDGSLGSYTSQSGVKFTTLTESDDSGEKTAHIAQVMLGEYEYALVFFGFDEAQRKEIIDSTDLSVYR